MDNYNGFNENGNNQETNTGCYGNYPVNEGNMNSTGQNGNNDNKKRKKSNPVALVLVAALLIGGSAGGGVYLGNMLSARQAALNQTVAKTDTVKENNQKYSYSCQYIG